MKFAVATLALALAPLYAQAIDRPTDLQGTQIAEHTVAFSWAPVEGASRYEVTVNGIGRGLITETSITVGDMHNGDGSLHLRTLDADGFYSYQSETLLMQISDDAVTTLTPRAVEGTRSPEEADVAENVAEDIDEGADEDRGEAPARDEADTGLIDPESYRYSEVNEKSGYELVFSDEFNGDSLSPTRWNTQLRWDGDWNGERYEYRVINGEDQLYVNTLGPDQEHLDTVASVYDPFKFNGEHLSIRSTKNPLKTTDGSQSYGPLRDIARQQDFLSGVISTHNKFYRKYGYFEASIRIPSHDGTFPAFWLFHQNRRSTGIPTQRTEIDIMENLGHAPWYIYNSFHYFKGANEYTVGQHNFVKPSPSGQVYSGTDYSEAFHTYAVKWEPGHIVWYIDDQQVSEVYSDEANYEELYLKINLAMGGKWTNYPANAGGLGRSSGNHFPNSEDLANFKDPELEIDYVRVYARR